MSVDLALVAIGGVQRFLAESRKTVDLAGASLAVRHVVIEAATVVNRHLETLPAPLGLVFPTVATITRESDALPVGVTNKIAFLAPPGEGPDLAKAAAKAATGAWQKWVRKAFDGRLPDTPGWPDVTWVCATGDEEAYPDLWKRVQLLMIERRRARVFVPEWWQGRTLCTQAPAQPAEPAPQTAAKRDRAERLSAAGWTKRYVGNEHHPQGKRFPSTTVIASSAFRARLVRAATDPAVRVELSALIEELHAVLPADAVAHQGLPGVVVPTELTKLSTWLGTMISPDAWESGGPDTDGLDGGRCREGRRVTREIGALAQNRGVRALTPYYAIVLQDLDKLGRAVADLGLDEQRAASDVLTGLGVKQLTLSEAHLGVPIYAGGDDFLAFAPAAQALALAAELRVLTTEHLAGSPLAGATASTAVVFAHMTSPLQDVVATAQDALTRAKNSVRDGAQRDALTVVVLRAGGERARTIQPWSTTGGDHAADLLWRVAPAATPADLSARLAAKLERDQGEFDQLAEVDRLHRTLKLEVARLVMRQGGSEDVADAVTVLGRAERSGAEGDKRFFRPVPATLVARFLAQECR
ncbi:Cas10/Cmr2 second palm domain-containing protein [Actinokineospora sp.]|uniref:Cas10/Cmr2 second palm domain-containing protein n=1 Tax=Actinokineospora sp. TaxID=1872133 RepID=UPI004037D96A